MKSALDFDSFVFDPHKWLLTNFDCAAHFLKDPSELERALTVLPAYLKSAETGQTPEYRDWTIPLGRRFRALKLWFVLRSYGTDQLKSIVRNHIQLAQSLARKIEASESLELTSPVSFGLLTFRLKPLPGENVEATNRRTANLLRRINDKGKIYLTQTQINEKYVIRVSVGQTYTQERHIHEAWEAIESRID